jgi:hypothetical protein
LNLRTKKEQLAHKSAESALSLRNQAEIYAKKTLKAHLQKTCSGIFRWNAHNAGQRSPIGASAAVQQRQI